LAPGGKAVIKPNWVMDVNPNGNTLDSLITHSAIIKHVIDWCAAAMQGEGSIVIGDCPLQSCDFDRMLRFSRVGDIVDLARRQYPNLDIKLEDWRLTIMRGKAGGGKDSRRDQLHRADHDERMQRDYALVDLGKESFLEDIAEFSEEFRVTCYNSDLMMDHHRPGKHEYLITKRVFDVDLVINLPKMKTHIKAGLTGALKNLVGINGHKEFLPHHIKGSYFEGGDWCCNPSVFAKWYEDINDYYWKNCQEMSRLKRTFYQTLLGRLHSLSYRVDNGITAGSWSGNETIWRTTLDLNHALYFSPNSARRIISILDGIVAGQGDGPLSPTPRPMGIIIAGENPAYVDAVAAKTMGYNISRVPTLYNAIYHRKSKFSGPDPLDYSVTCVNRDGKPEQAPFDGLQVHSFTKPRAWKRAESPGKPGETCRG
jgi:uncharacterized protein (DUF362 family)